MFVCLCLTTKDIKLFVWMHSLFSISYYQFVHLKPHQLVITGKICEWKDAFLYMYSTFESIFTFSRFLCLQCYLPDLSMLNLCRFPPGIVPNMKVPLIHQIAHQSIYLFMTAKTPDLTNVQYYLRSAYAIAGWSHCWILLPATSAFHPTFIQKLSNIPDTVFIFFDFNSVYFIFIKTNLKETEGLCLSSCNKIYALYVIMTFSFKFSDSASASKQSKKKWRRDTPPKSSVSPAKMLQNLSSEVPRRSKIFHSKVASPLPEHVEITRHP